MKKNFIALVVVLLTFSFNVNAQETIKNFKGTWEYECSEAENGYQTGLIIVEQKDRPTVKVVFKDNTEVQGEFVKVKEGVLHFSIKVEEGLVDVELKRNGKKLEGKSFIGYGDELKVTATKKK